jgi:hypothetical protein
VAVVTDVTDASVGQVSEAAAPAPRVTATEAVADDVPSRMTRTRQIRPGDATYDGLFASDPAEARQKRKAVPCVSRVAGYSGLLRSMVRTIADENLLRACG